MIRYNDVTKENINQYNLNWPQIFDHPYKILTTGGSGSGKTNALRNLIKQQDDDDDDDDDYSINDKIYLCVKDLCETNYQYLI